jgi:hypothetical protein
LTFQASFYPIKIFYYGITNLFLHTGKNLEENTVLLGEKIKRKRAERRSRRKKESRAAKPPKKREREWGRE